MKNLTYANVMSTIAMFAAVSTGGAYAATTLGPNVVKSGNIRNGQVALADLHPTVRKRLGVAARPVSGGGVAVPAGTWTNLTLPNPGLEIRRCTNTSCAGEFVYPIPFSRHSIPAGTATYDATVTLTNNGNVSMFVEGKIVGSDGSPIGYGICNPPSRGVEAGATVTYTCRVSGKASAVATLRYTTRAVYGIDLVTPEANVVLSATVTGLRVLSNPA